ncbi:MAG: encapsulin-associated ferritin-like protein [Persicimonas sp.]
MAESSAQLHEARADLDASTLEFHRALVSLMEELEAIDWYQQRIDATDDDELAEVLAHNRNEEREHAAMTLEWLRRRDAGLDEVLRTYLFTEERIIDIEEEEEDSGDHQQAAQRGDASLGIGSLRS